MITLIDSLVSKVGCNRSRKFFRKLKSCLNLHIGLKNYPINNAVLNEGTNYDKKHLVAATTELILLNNRWQRAIKNEKEQKRNAFMMIGMGNEYIEQNDTIENQIGEGTDNTLPSISANDKEVLNFDHVPSVTKVTIPVENAREHIADKFTLNKNQKAAFMIITGHLDGIDRLNEGMYMQMLK